MNVLRHVRVQHGQSIGIRNVTSSARYLAVLHSSQFVILHPEVCLEDFRRCRKSQQRCVPPRQFSTLFFPAFPAERGKSGFEKARGHCRGSRRKGTSLEKRTSTRARFDTSKYRICHLSFSPEELGGLKEISSGWY